MCFNSHLQKVSTDVQFALEVVSYIGCAISIVCLLITVVFFLIQGYVINNRITGLMLTVVTVVLISQKEVVHQSPLFRSP